jgi:hypothetical protein
MGSSLPNQAQRPVRPLTLLLTFLFQITQDIEITTCYHARSSAALAWLLSFCCVPLPRKNSSRLQSLSRQKDAVSVAVHVASVSFVKCGAVAFALGPEGMSSLHSQRERGAGPGPFSRLLERCTDGSRMGARKRLLGGRGLRFLSN